MLKYMQSFLGSRNLVVRKKFRFSFGFFLKIDSTPGISSKEKWWFLIRMLVSYATLVKKKCWNISSFQCPFAVSCWNLLHLQVPLQATVLEIMDSLAAQLRMPIFMNILILLCWTIWCTRNGVIFDNQSASLPSCKVFFKKEITLLLHRVKPKHQVRLEEWINSIG